jgi:hypothetical protein
MAQGRNKYHGRPNVEELEPIMTDPGRSSIHKDHDSEVQLEQAVHSPIARSPEQRQAALQAALEHDPGISKWSFTAIQVCCTTPVIIDTAEGGVLDVSHYTDCLLLFWRQRVRWDGMFFTARK